MKFLIFLGLLGIVQATPMIQVVLDPSTPAAGTHYCPNQSSCSNLLLMNIKFIASEIVTLQSLVFEGQGLGLVLDLTVSDGNTLLGEAVAAPGDKAYFHIARVLPEHLAASISLRASFYFSPYENTGGYITPALIEVRGFDLNGVAFLLQPNLIGNRVVAVHAPIPEPATMFLVLSAGLFFVNLRRKK